MTRLANQFKPVGSSASMRGAVVFIIALLMFPSTVWGYGEPVDGFPNYYERVIHLLTNEARSDPATALAPCANGNCPDAPCFTAPVAALQYSQALNYSARLHSLSLSSSGCSLAHASPCNLVSNIGSTFPGSCDGSTSCACSGSVTCGNGTQTFDRFALFGIDLYTRAENIAYRFDPERVFNLWLHEPSSSSACKRDSLNGHRWNILNPNVRILGVGEDPRFVVQDFGTESVTEKILVGAHLAGSGTSVTFKASWADGQGPQSAQVNIDGTCQPLALTRGSTTNGIYSHDQQVSGCAKYYFIFKDSSGNEHTYPDVGAFGVNCGQDYFTTRSAPDASCGVCQPNCSQKTCGDNGCGGSCGSCGPNEDCVANTCELQCSAGLQVCNQLCVNTATDENNCGNCNQRCPSGETCVQGNCDLVCSNGQTKCNGTCVNADNHPNHCGGCGISCSSQQVCSNGVCTTNCQNGQSLCGAACVSLSSDPTHCGQCANTCGPQESCVQGSCVLDCPSGTIECANQCVNPDIDRLNCGGCGIACLANQSCSGGACIVDKCDAGLAKCGAVCADLSANPQHCGTCDAGCGAGQICDVGMCVTPMTEVDMVAVSDVSSPADVADPPPTTPDLGGTMDPSVTMDVGMTFDPAPQDTGPQQEPNDQNLGPIMNQGSCGCQIRPARSTPLSVGVLLLLALVVGRRSRTRGGH